MKYLLLIYEEEARFGRLSDSERAAFMAEYRAVVGDHKAARKDENG
jgi:hypothetical protein